MEGTSKPIYVSREGVQHYAGNDGRMSPGLYLSADQHHGFIAEMLPSSTKILNCESNQYLRRTPITRPCTLTLAAGKTIGVISELAGCSRILPEPSR